MESVSDSPARRAIVVCLWLLSAASLRAGEPAKPPSPIPRSVLSDISGRRETRAIKALFEIVRKEPANKAAWFLLGAAYNRLGLHARAEQYLGRAAALGADSPGLHREMGIALAGQKKADEARQHLDLADPRDPLAARTRAFMARPAWRRAARESEGKWGFHLTLGTAYNDNVTLRADEAIRVPGERAGTRAMGLTVGLRAERRLWREGADRVRAVFGFGHTRYDDLHEFSPTDLTAGLELSRRTPDYAVWALPVIRQSYTHDESYCTSLALPLGGEVRLASCCALGAGYTLRWDDYHFREALRDERLDGLHHRLAMGPRFWTADGRLGCRTVVTYDRNHAAGDSMRYRAWGTEVGANYRVHPRVTLLGSWSYRKPRYLHDNVRSPAAALEPRRDTTHTFYVGVAWRMQENQRAVLYYSRQTNHSNIPAFYEYDQNAVGVSYHIAF